jgi:hypothetical protein
MRTNSLQVFTASLFLILVLGTGCKESTEPPTAHVIPDSSGMVTIKKPNIYLYPTVRSSFSVQLKFPSGGKVIESIPAYRSGWQVDAEPNGRINGTYEYLFYECETTDLFQYSSGWIVPRDSLAGFFERNLTETGFLERERADFLEYWIPLLSDHSAYVIYPQYSPDIEPIVSLSFTKTPDAVLRLFYIINGSESSGGSVKLNTPVVPAFERKGFAVTEWGVVLK